MSVHEDSLDRMDHETDGQVRDLAIDVEFLQVMATGRAWVLLGNPNLQRKMTTRMQYAL